MGPFGVIDVHAETHTPGASCAGCTLDGYPQPCPVVLSRTIEDIRNQEGKPVGQRWAETTCGDQGGHVHAELAFGVVETRCDRCGVAR